jgi:hypothetical protein
MIYGALTLKIKLNQRIGIGFPKQGGHKKRTFNPEEKCWAHWKKSHNKLYNIDF